MTKEDKAAAQLIFDRVVAHARTMKKPCQDAEGRCMYHHGKERCFIGCLIPDADYDPGEMEHKRLDEVFASLGIYLDDTAYEFLRSLQLAHDNRPQYLWEFQFLHIAQGYGLRFVPPAENDAA